MLTFVYGSEKEEWLKDVTADFNSRKIKSASGKTIAIHAIPLGSGETIEGALSGNIKADLLSPASGAFVEVGNLKSRGATGSDLIGRTEPLVLSPVVIAMWQPMAEALGWPDKPIGWGEIIEFSKNPQGWASKGHPEWGAFKLGHTHPSFSNSGLITMLAACYAAAGKQAGLTIDDLSQEKVRDYLRDIEQAVVHYGSSTGFFAKKMFNNGPSYLSAAVLYESSVIESKDPKYRLPFPVVAIYPKEGTFWSDHPVGVVNRDWVTPERKEAAEAYVKFLLEPGQQAKALKYGFRPASTEVPLGPPIAKDFGVDPSEPKNTLQLPSAEVIEKVLAVFREVKKGADVALVIDTSGSMAQDNRMAGAKEGALKLVEALDDRDLFSLLLFSNVLQPITANAHLEKSRQQVVQAINNSYPDGGTALYDATLAAYRAQSGKQGKSIRAVVVLTDGEDRDSSVSLDQLLAEIEFDPEKKPVRIFTIGYGGSANAKILKSIADATQAKYYEGNPKNITEVFRDIATFF
jgi:Ca-activated chloride channel family protein